MDLNQIQIQNQESKILFQKNDILLEKINNNTFQLTMEMENKFINLISIIDFDLLKLLYDLNKDIYEKIIFEKINENEVIATLLMKHFFIDLGLPQRYSFMHIKKKIGKEGKEDSFEFISTPIFAEKPEFIPSICEVIPFEKINTKFEKVKDCSIKIICTILFQENISFPGFLEKIVGPIIFKIFNRLKQFIEKYRI